MHIQKILKGSVVALVTPFDKGKGRINNHQLDKLIEWHIEQGTDGIVVAGTTGECPTLTTNEQLKLIAHCIERVRYRIPVIAGTGSNSTHEASILTRGAKHRGAEFVLSCVPYYNNPPPECLIRHFETLADVSDLKHIVYNVPGRTVVDLLPETLAEIAKHENVIGIKEATGDISRVQKIKELCGDEFLLFSGDDTTCCEFMLNGGHGVISVTANIFPAVMKKLCLLALGNDDVSAKELNEILMPIHQALFLKSNPIPVKFALSLREMIYNTMRLPLLPLSGDDTVASSIKDAIEVVERELS